MSYSQMSTFPAQPWDTERLMERAPDIARKIAAAWGDVSSTAALLEQLLVDDDVRHMEPAVASDLLRLYDIYARTSERNDNGAHCEAQDTSWELPVSRLQQHRTNVI